MTSELNRYEVRVNYIEKSHVFYDTVVFAVDHEAAEQQARLLFLDQRKDEVEIVKTEAIHKPRSNA